MNVVLINDDTVEGNENFQCRLTIVTTGTTAAASPSVADVTILDDERKIIVSEQSKHCFGIYYF